MEYPNRGQTVYKCPEVGGVTSGKKETRKGEKQPVKGRMVGDRVEESRDQILHGALPTVFLRECYVSTWVQLDAISSSMFYL